MSRRAFDCFVESKKGVWICTRDSTVPAAIDGFQIPVVKGMEFSGRTVFAGHADFVAFLDSNAVDARDPVGRAA